jgi:hypothetical protein
MVANRARQRYFDPSEDTERKFVGLGQRVRTRFESFDECPDARRQGDTNRTSNTRVSGQNFLLARRIDEEISNPALSTTLPIHCALKSLIVSQDPISKCVQ